MIDENKDNKAYLYICYAISIQSEPATRKYNAYKPF